MKYLGGAALILVMGAAHAEVRVEVVDRTFDPAGAMLAYSEFELSGEPLAESLGLDLGVLDPNRLDQPTRFDYVTGIESYEYSEEAMYALNYQSRMGPHLVNGPRNRTRGGNGESLQKRIAVLAKSVAYPFEDLPLNLYPISLPYQSGSPEFDAGVDVAEAAGEEIDLLDAQGKSRLLKAKRPAYLSDYHTLGWNESKMHRVLNPAAVGGILLKEVLWSQDFLGGMHTVENDEEVEAATASMDRDGIHALGVSSADGFNGVLLTEISLDKMLLIQSRLGYDGKSLGVAFGPEYDPMRKPVWLPHQVAVTEQQANGTKALGELKVADARSTLRDTWLLLWATSEYYGFTDQREANQSQNPSFRAVFDGHPFESAPAVNRDADTKNDVAGTDAFSLAANLSNLLFKNLQALHFDAKAGTLVDEYRSGQQGGHVIAYDAAYSLVALTTFQRAMDALPVGYVTAGSGSVHLNTLQGKQALDLTRRQADFILANLIGKNGLVYDGMHLRGTQDKKPKLDENQSLDSQFAVVHGLTTAFNATGDVRYRQAARQLYIAIEKNMYDAKLGTWAMKPGQATEYTPWTAAAVASGMRSAMLQLKNAEGEKEPELELARLTERHVSWFRTLINGPALGQGMQLAEWPGDTGEHRVDAGNGDTDGDGVPQITSAGGDHGTAAVMAGKVLVFMK